MGFTETELLEQKKKHEVWLREQQGLTGVGLGLTAGGEPCLTIYTSRMPDETLLWKPVRSQRSLSGSLGIEPRQELRFGLDD